MDNEKGEGRGYPEMEIARYTHAFRIFCSFSKKYLYPIICSKEHPSPSCLATVFLCSWTAFASCSCDNPDFLRSFLFRPYHSTKLANTLNASDAGSSLMSMCLIGLAVLPLRHLRRYKLLLPLRRFLHLLDQALPRHWSQIRELVWRMRISNTEEIQRPLHHWSWVLLGW